MSGHWSLLNWLGLLLAGTGGCGEFLEHWQPDRAVVGVTARRVALSYRGLEVKTVGAVWDWRTKKELAANLDLYSRLQFVHGTLYAHRPVVAAQTTGSFQSVGLGLNYFPLPTRLLGLDLGVETYYAEHTMRGEFGPFLERRSDEFWGLGANLGLTGTIPLSHRQRWGLVWSTGYNFTQSGSRHARPDLDGWYGFLGLEIRLGGKR